MITREIVSTSLEDIRFVFIFGQAVEKHNVSLGESLGTYLIKCSDDTVADRRATELILRVTILVDLGSYDKFDLLPLRSAAELFDCLYFLAYPVEGVTGHAHYCLSSFT